MEFEISELEFQIRTHRIDIAAVKRALGFHSCGMLAHVQCRPNEEPIAAPFRNYRSFWMTTRRASANTWTSSTVLYR